MAVIELFDKTDLISYYKGNPKNKPNNVPDELDEIRNNYISKNWRVNEASMVFNVDSEKMPEPNETNNVYHPNRIYLYDLNNNTPLLDYIFDGSTSVTGNPKKAKSIFGGMLNTDANKNKSYNIKITNYIRSIVKDTTATNVKLGLVVTEDINTTASAKLDKTKINAESISEIPRASVMSPLGTVLFGGNATEAKKIKLKIYYTKPNQ